MREVPVCMVAFASLHGVTRARVRRLASASLSSVHAPVDKRGKHANRPRSIPDSIKVQIDEHIRSFPAMKSHYSRGKNSRRRKYLSPHLNVSQMHELYVQKYEAGVERPIVSYHYYLKYFQENFNLSFGYPRTDTCSTCDQLQVQLDSASESTSMKALITEQKEEHLHKAERFYSSLRAHTQLAKENLHVAVISFDFQQNLPLPSIPVGEVFYMHQIWVYVFGVHNCGKNSASMYTWPEMIAGRGSDEVISCLNHYFETLPSEVTTLYLYSDGCGGQNKNLNVMHFLFSLVRVGRFQHIRHYFPVRGHSFLPNDRDFGCTELKKRKVERVFVPEEWNAVIRSARRRNPFTVVPVTQNMVLGYSTYFSPFFKKTVQAKKKALNIQRAMVLDYSSQHATQVWVKYRFEEDEPWNKFELEKRNTRIQCLPTVMAQKNPSPLPVKQRKINDVRKLVDKYVPQEYHHFYNSIAGDEEVSSETDESDEN